MDKILTVNDYINIMQNRSEIYFGENAVTVLQISRPPTLEHPNYARIELSNGYSIIILKDN